MKNLINRALVAEKKLFLLLAAVVMTASAMAQDVIFKTMNDSINAKVLTVNNSEVSYKLAGYEEGPLFTVRTSDIVAIRYANGMYQYFADIIGGVKNTKDANASDRKAEDKKGHVFIGGTAEIGYAGNFTFAVEPIIGYEFNDRVAIGTGIGPIVAAGGGVTVAMGVVEPFIRLCAWHNDIVFIDFKATAGIGFNEEMQLCQVGVRPSLRVRLTEHCEMAADIGLFGAQYTYDGGWTPAIGITATSAGLWFAYRF